MSSAVLGSLKLNSSVSVTSTMNGWAQIQFNGKTAFVSEAFLTNNKPTNNEPLKNDSTITSSSVYVIKSGDTITKISKALGVSVSSIQALNPTVDPSKLKIGQTIKVPTTPSSTTNQIQVVAQLGGVDSQGTFRFITSDGSTYAAKASGNMLNELYKHQGKQVTLTLEGNRGQQMTLISLQ
jgi:LysM repeat protein